MSDIRITNCEFSHTAMTGLFVSHVSNLVADRNVFTDIGELLSNSTTSAANQLIGEVVQSRRRPPTRAFS